MKVPLGMDFLIADTFTGRRTSPKLSAIARWIGVWCAECLAEISDEHKKRRVKRAVLVLVEAGGIEPPSANPPPLALHA